MAFQCRDGVALDQLRHVDRQRFLKKLGAIDEDTTGQVKETIKIMLVE
nr:type II toxin-antitoxin system PemK/MazF family toxin [Candidatus Sigynarchaeum springense]